MKSIEDFLGKTALKVECVEDELRFYFSEGFASLYHDQDCCENVSIESINGPLEHLVGVPFTLADESVSSEEPEGWKDDGYRDESETWTFYRFATSKGYVDVRWYGSSNGYYSESVDFHWTPIEPH